MDRSPLIAFIKQHSLRFGEFTLASQQTSHYLFDLKTTVLHPKGSVLVADAILDQVRLYCDRIDAFGGMAVGAVPIIAVLCCRSLTCQPIPGFFVRKNSKGHGSNLLIDGCLQPGMRTVLIEDVITTAGSVMQAITAVREFGASVDEVIAVVDRLEGGRENLQQIGVPLTSLTTRDDYF